MVRPGVADSVMPLLAVWVTVGSDFLLLNASGSTLLGAGRLPTFALVLRLPRFAKGMASILDACRAEAAVAALEQSHCLGPVHG